MSEYGLFEADHVAQQEPQHQQRVAAARFASAVDAVKADYGHFLFAADGVDNFEDRLGAVRKDIVATVVRFVPVYPKVMREVVGSLKAEWRRQAGEEKGRGWGGDPDNAKGDWRKVTDEQRANGEADKEVYDKYGTRIAEIGKDHDRDTQKTDKPTTINPKQRAKQRSDDPDMGKSVETNTGDGSDSSGKNKRDPQHGDSGKVVNVPKGDSRHTSKVAGSVSCPTCGKNLHDEVARLGHGHGPNGEVYDADPQYGHESRGDYMSRGQGGLPPTRQGARYAEFDDEAGDTIGSDFAPGDHDRWEDSGRAGERESRRYYAEDRDAPPLIPEGDFHAYEDRVDRGGPEKVQRDFGAGDDTGVDRAGSEGDHIAAKLALDLYSDWAQSNGLRVASTETLEHYAATGVDDADYFTIASAIRRAECECPDDDHDRDDEGDHDEESGPPPFASSDDGGDDDSEDSGDDGGDDSGDESDSDSDSGDDSGYEDEDSGGEESDTGDDDSDGDEGGNPFADDSDVPGPADDGDDFAPSANDIPPADDQGPPGPDEGPPGLDEQGPPGPDEGGDFGQPGPPDVAPDQFPPDDQQGTAPIDPVLIDQLLGLPPGTVEGLIADAVGGQPDDPAQALPGDSPAPWLTAAHLKKATRAERNRAYLEAFERLGFNRLAEDDGGGGSAPADPSMGGADQLLDTALQAVTQTVDQKTQEFQQVIDPLTQALQAIEYAQTVEQAENPLDVTPPQGTVDVNPSAAPAAQEAQQAMGEAAGGAPPAAAPPAPPTAPDPRQQQAAYRVAKHHGLGQAAYNMMVTAMSRRHYEHVAEAIRGLPFEHRPGIAASMADMFKTDNGRFNPTQFYTSAGVTAARHGGTDAPAGSTAGDPGVGGAGMGDIAGGMDSTVANDLSDPVTASRRPLGRGRQAAANWAPQTQLDSFSFPNTKPAAPNDNIAVDNLPTIKAPAGKTASYDWATWERRASHDVEAKGVLDMFKTWSQGQQSKGLNTGAPADAVTKFQTEKPSLGEGQINKLKTTVGVPGAGEEKVSHRRTANWFMPKVAGWDWDDYQNGYLSKTARDFETPCCHSVMPVPSHGNCRCGKLWNGYGIGDERHLASGTAERFIVREIEVRDGVIMAGRHVEACWPGCHEDEEHSRKYHKDDKEASYRVGEEHTQERDYNGEADYNKDIDDPGYDVAEDVQWEPDEDREDAEAPHAPGKNAAREEWEPDEYQYERWNKNLDEGRGPHENGDEYAGTSPQTHPHLYASSGLNPFMPHTADWTKYDEPDPARKGGPKKPPSTAVSQPPSDWAKRDDKGNWQGPAIPKR